MTTSPDEGYRINPAEGRQNTTSWVSTLACYIANERNSSPCPVQIPVVVSARESRRPVFRQIAQRSHADWPIYSSTPLHERSSLDDPASAIRTVSQIRFGHGRHESVDLLVCSLPLACFKFDARDRYAGATRYGMDTLVRIFALEALYGWDHETAPSEYIECRTELRERLELKSVPDQSTLWRSWHRRFTTDLRETVGRVARTVLAKAQNADVTVPREPAKPSRVVAMTRTSRLHTAEPFWTTSGRSPSTSVASSSPAFSLDRGDGCEGHGNAYWGLQTYLGLRENWAANGGARSFISRSIGGRLGVATGRSSGLWPLS